jgi:GT2 family glycosyltransferase
MVRSLQNVSAVIVNYEGGELLLDCLAALERQPGLLETIVVDNGSADGSVDLAARRFPTIKVVRPVRNLGFAGGVNAGAQAASGELLLFLNPDVSFPPGCVSALAKEFSDRSVGVVGPPLYVVAGGGMEYGCTIDPIGSPVALHQRVRPLYVSGCALMTRARLFHELGGFDERFFMVFEDIDYCWRVLLRGFDVRIANSTPVRHEGGAVTPGGYIVAARVTSTRFRVALRERNTLATLLKCYGDPLVFAIVPLYVLQSLATAAMLAVVGRQKTATDIVGGLWWNARELPRTMVLRRRTQGSRRIAERAILTRMHRGVLKISLLIRFGIPSVSDEAAFNWADGFSWKRTANGLMQLALGTRTATAPRPRPRAAIRAE